jgi:hypothetical protein
MSRISVVAIPPLDSSSWRYDVEVIEIDGGGPNKTTHEVTMDKDYYVDLTEGKLVNPEEFVKKSFEFLLEREFKDSVLRQFDIAQISDYFPEYENEIKKALVNI